ncbi:TadE/TadG family type IV pilus assembly protein [Sphingopyxis sp.]|uniref:TadE/TadG family type IV pilus assembly protein n=1 Tax=Sphingopyxis sp. TaxID=1908224 RepID=UPI003F70CCF6
MTAFPLWTKLASRRSSRRRFARDNRAAVMIEMAFCIPLLVFVGFGGIEMANLTLVNTRISQISLSTADNASRIAFGRNMSLPQVRELDINEVFTGAEEQARGLNLRANGRIVLSSLERNADGGQMIKWQRCYGDLPVQSLYGTEGTGASGTSFPGMGPVGKRVVAVEGTAVMVVELTYTYQPVAYGRWLGPRTIRSEAAFNVREGRDLTRVYPSAGVTPSDCDT